MTTTTNPSSIPAEWDRNLTTRAERYAAGKALRNEASRSSHAEWAPDSERPDPISILEDANKTRLQNLVPIRFGRMSTVSVRVLSRNSRHHGVRPVEDTRLRHPGADLW